MDKDVIFTKKYYNKDSNVKRYGEAVEKIGLWNSEKILFDKYLNKSDKILDIGCGAGRTTINLYKLGYKDIIGVDISTNLINYAKTYSDLHNLNIAFEEGDATNLNYDDGTFDVVIFSYNGMQSIPGVKNRNKVLHEVYRVLKPGGLYIFTAHNRDDSGEHQYIWDEEKTKWKKGTQDKNLELFGDKYVIDKTGLKTFIHFSNIEEMKNFIHQEKFEILEYKKSTDIAKENKLTKEFAGVTIFWILKK